MKQIELPHQTPEQLLSFLDSEIAQQRARKAGHSRKRALVLIFGLLLVFGMGTVAFLVLFEMIGNLETVRR